MEQAKEEVRKREAAEEKEREIKRRREKAAELLSKMSSETPAESEPA